MVLKIIYFGMAVALVLSIIIIPLIIPYMKRLKFGQSIRLEGPASHQNKSGTPTMGGIVFSLVTLVVVLLFYLFYNRGLIEFNLTNWTLIFVPLFGYALIGFIDDYLIVVKKNNEGLKPKIKFALQIIIAALFFYLYLKNDYPTEIYFTKSLYLDFKINLCRIIIF